MTLQFNRYSHRIKVILNSTNVSQFYHFCCTEKQINAGLVSSRKLFIKKIVLFKNICRVVYESSSVNANAFVNVNDISNAKANAFVIVNAKAIANAFVNVNDFSNANNNVFANVNTNANVNANAKVNANAFVNVNDFSNA